jgi:hypothetical protein
MPIYCKDDRLAGTLADRDIVIKGHRAEQRPRADDRRKIAAHDELTAPRR